MMRGSAPAVVARIIIGLALAVPQSMLYDGAVTTPGSLSVCQVLANPIRYDGGIVRIRGKVVGTDEGAWLSSDDCPGIFNTDGRPWPSLISLDMPPLPAIL